MDTAEEVNAKLRIARATDDLERVSIMYSEGLGLKILGSFKDHAGFDGVMLGAEGVDYHFEFTHERGQRAPRSHSPEQLVVFYVDSIEQMEDLKNRMVSAGFRIAKSHNPYWDQHGHTFEDFEGYRIVLCHHKLFD